MPKDNKKYPKVLVGCPTSEHKEYCLKEYAEAVKNLSYPNYDILLVDNSKDNEYYERIKSMGIKVKRTKYTKKARDRIIEGRNLLRKKVLDEGYDYFLSLEQDVIPPNDVIERLLRYNKQVTAGVYFLVNPFKDEHRIRSSIWANYNPKTKMMYRVKNEYILQNPKLMEVSASGLGCILIHRDVLNKIRFRYDKETEGFDDVFFAKDLRKNRIKIYADLSVICKHLVKNWSWKGIEK
jgi:GT2 family glycosyltransferase